MKNKKFSVSDRLKSFKYAFNGFKILFRDEHNARIHLLAAIVAIVLGWFLKISLTEWLAISIVIGLVFITEIINSCIENMADFISPEKHHQIKKIKDLAAAAVLLSAILAVVIGLLIFIPRFISLLTNPL